MLQHEAYVTDRFDALQARFKDRLADRDYRLEALRRVLGPLEGRRILDIGCGKGRFARKLQSARADVIALDRSAGMMAHAVGLDRVRGTSCFLPLASDSFDAVIAIEVLEHVACLDAVLCEIERVLRPGGLVAILDKNVWSLSALRPAVPNILIKWLDERRGRWMYPPGAPVRERWFRPRDLLRRLRRHFDSAAVEQLLAPAEAGHFVFRSLPATRLMCLWTARKQGGPLG
jgi:2-polyprenyl-6-hydroxyphenyl methylase/3-demethylubiquinone-9 3-methyltransferase